MMEVVHKDAIEYLSQFEDEVFDLIILDPDYNDWDKLLGRDILHKCLRVLKPSGNILCFTKQPFDYNLRIAVQPYFRREIVWTFDNGGAWCSPKMPLVSAQKIYWLVKSKAFYFNPRTGIAYSDKTKDFKRSKKVFGDYEAEGKDFVKSSEGVWLRDHLHYNKPNSGKIPAKPRELINVLIRCFCCDGGAVLDPFAGIGTTMFCCDEQAKECYSCDIDEQRVFNILDRMSEERTG